MPCLLRGHRMWHTGRERLVTGLEMLKAHGFPDTVITSGVVKGDPVEVPVACHDYLWGSLVTNVCLFFFLL